jgi:hypothetical protein
VELYNLKEDPSESNDLATRDPDRTEKMLRTLRGWRRDIDAQMPSPNPDYRR